MKNKVVKIVLIVVACIVAAVLLFFVGRHIYANVNVASRANEIGEEYGVTDFYSKSTDLFGEVRSIKLNSKDFASLSEEDKMALMISMSTDEEMKSNLVEERQKEVNPLTDWYFEIISGGTFHTIEVLSDYNMLKFSGGVQRKLENAESYGFELEFHNEYGTADTICAFNGCTNTIVRTGNSNACIDHAGICTGCHKYIDKGKSKCEYCAQRLIEEGYKILDEAYRD